jgi:DNA-binding CsgD family transcriptional regulator
MTLSAREAEVLSLAADGLTNQQIAKRLGLGEETVKTHLKRITRKLGAYNRAHCVAIALRLEIIW